VFWRVSLLRGGDGRAAIFRASTKAGESGEHVVSAGVTTLGSECRGGVLYSNITFPIAAAGSFFGVEDAKDAAELPSVSSNGCETLFLLDRCEAALFFF
jgi:hypothetical protein